MNISRLLVAMGVMVLASHEGHAQVTDTTQDFDYCLGFAFGSWKPALDLEAAGHKAVVDTSRFARAAVGRDWATSGTKAAGDTTIVLFPIWWPAGVVISLEHTPRSPGDTVHGRAMALVADGRKASPTSSIRAWEKRCGR